MIRHLILLRLRADISEAHRTALYSDMAKIAAGFEGVLDFQTRENISPEDDLVRGFRHMFWFDIDSEDTRDRFLEDKPHLAVARRVVDACEGGLDGVTVLDFEID